MNPRIHDPNPALLAILRDCRTHLRTALKAAEIEATPGPGWRASTSATLDLIDRILTPKQTHVQRLTTEDRDGHPITPTCVGCGNAAERCDGTVENSR